MDKYSLGVIIGERSYSLGDGVKIMVRVGMPQEMSDHSMYFCPYEIVGWERTSLRRAVGIDSLDSIQSAFQKIGMELHECSRAFDNSIRWVGGEEGDIGFLLRPEILSVLSGSRSVKSGRRQASKKMRRAVRSPKKGKKGV